VAKSGVVSVPFCRVGTKGVKAERGGKEGLEILVVEMGAAKLSRGGTREKRGPDFHC
jgi:hypothetical protein